MRGHNGNDMSRRRSSHKKGPAILFGAQAKNLARDVLEEVAGDEAGKHLGVMVRDGLGVHRFESLTPGYKGWEWVAVLTCVPGTEDLTVNEVSLQAGKTAQLAPEWIPYEDRVLPGDLGPGDVLPPKHGDERLVEPSTLADEDGFCRNQQAEMVLSDVGLKEAAKRWRAARGRGTPMARRAEHQCATCAFFLPWRENSVSYGICANEFSADGRVVDARYGCGAHSESKEASLVSNGKDYGAFDDGQ